MIGDPPGNDDAGEEEPPCLFTVELDCRDVIPIPQSSWRDLVGYGSLIDLSLRQNSRTRTTNVTVMTADTTAAISMPSRTAGFIVALPLIPAGLGHVEELA
jgi:hypothetical protein